MRFALDNDALRRVVAVAIRRARCVRRGYKKEQRSCEKNVVLLFIARVVAVIKTFGRSPIPNNPKRKQSTLP